MLWLQTQEVLWWGWKQRETGRCSQMLDNRQICVWRGGWGGGSSISKIKFMRNHDSKIKLCLCCRREKNFSIADAIRYCHRAFQLEISIQKFPASGGSFANKLISHIVFQSFVNIIRGNPLEWHSFDPRKISNHFKEYPHCTTHIKESQTLEWMSLATDTLHSRLYSYGSASSTGTCRICRIWKVSKGQNQDLGIQNHPPPSIRGTQKMIDPKI